MENNSNSTLRALDVGAGAGLSTAVLYHECHFHTIDAIDWSDTAWNANVVEKPDSVQWFPMDDDRFLQQHATPHSYQAIVYNFAINSDKAVRVAINYLTDNGVLLAPVNDKNDYWYKQTYWLLDAQGQTVWKSDPEVGAWSVQFQPDVTSNTCTGIWCGDVNGFKTKR